MTKTNPYGLVFGKEPKQYISRAAQISEISETFLEDPPTQQIYMITGLRGSGKTVFMTEAAKEITSNKNWYLVELSSAGNLLEDLAAALASEDQFAKLFKSASLNLSFFGIGLEVKGSVPITNLQTALTKMLENLKKHGKKLLICIDEVVNNPSMRSFAAAFQIFVRQNLPVYLLMTGLYENINNLQNEENLTFLYRAPKIEMKPLNIRRIADNYHNVFKISDKDSLEMAKLTRGYSFAFQVLGHFAWKHNGKYKEALNDYSQYLEDYVFDKIWSELSEGDRRFVAGVADSKSGKASEIKKILNLQDHEYSPYRDRLVKKGILDGSERGYVRFVLPTFEDFVSYRSELS